MKFLIFFLCLSVTTAGNIGHFYTQGYSGPLAGSPALIPAAASGGLVPADEPAVAKARADHLALLGSSYASGYGYGGVVAGPAVSYATAPVALGHGYSGPLAGFPHLVPGAASGGLVPANTPDVVAARADFAAQGGAVIPAPDTIAYAVAPAISYAAAPAAIGYAAGYGYSGPLAGAPHLVPTAASGGLVPANTPDVVAARAYFAAQGGAVIPAPDTFAYAAAPAISYAAAPAAIGYASGYGYSGPLAGAPHLVPGAASGGLVPANTPDVAAARAAFAAQGGAVIPAPDTIAYAAPVVSHVSAPAAIGYASGYSYSGPLAGVPALVPAAASGGLVPADEPAVAAARADHLALLGSSYSAGPAIISAPAIGYGYSGPLAGVPHLVPAAASGGLVPADEPAVVAARAEHLALGGGIVGGVYGAAYGHGSGYGGLVSYPNGAIVPVDEPAVAAARAEHLALGGGVYGAGYGHGAGGGHGAGYGGLVSYPNGAIVPVDEPAVAAARAEHLALRGGIVGGVYGGVYGAGYGGLVSYPNGAIVPVDEPAVAAARAEHLALKGASGW